jgi:hypothetical protein
MNGWLMKSAWIFWRGEWEKAAVIKFNVVFSEKDNENLAMVGLRVELWIRGLPITKQEYFYVSNI